MGESTCLLRSFSDNSCVAKEGDPIRMLGESISFGRFLSESLAWEKWSTFSHNRYVEEALRISKPGSVAEKKAYFESHFRRKAAQRAAAENAAPLIQEANGSSKGTFDSETQGGNCNGSSIQPRSTVHSNSAKDVIDYEISSCASTNDYGCDTEQSEVGISKVESAEDMAQHPLDTNLNEENSVVVDDSNHFDNIEVHEKFVIIKEERMPDLDIVKNLALPVQRKEINSCPKLPSKTRSAVERKARIAARDKINNAPKINKSVGDSAETKRPSARSLHLSANFPTRAGKVSRSVGDSAEEKRKAAVPPKDKLNNAPKISESAGDSAEKKRPSARSLHMSVNFPTRAGQASNGVSNSASINPQSGGRRTERLLNKSVSGGVTANGKLPTLSVDCLRSSRNTRSPTTSLPFRFKSEERAAKRKEFLRRMEETKSREADEVVQLQKRCKEKTQHGYRELLQRYGITPNANGNVNHGLQTTHNGKRTISLTRPRSPKLGRKASSGTVQDKNSKNSQKPPISAGSSKHVTEKANSKRVTVQDKNSENSRKPPISASNSKHVTEKANLSTDSFTSMTSRIRRENASPNIQR